MKTSLLPLLLFFILNINVSFAQNNTFTNFSSLKNEITAYHQEKLNPVFEQQRSKLNQFLQKEDKMTIYALARQFEKQQLQKNQLLSQKQPNGESFMETWEELQRREVDILIEVEGFVEKYETIIKQLLKEEIQSQIKKWQTEINQILVKYNVSQQYPTQRHFAKHGYGHWSNPAYFLLWNAEKPVSNEAAAETGSSVFPNPAKSEQSIQFYLSESQKVEIQLLDAQGKLQKILVKKDFPEGNHVLTIPLQDLANGLYFYKIISLQQVMMKKIVKE
jgi:hypothetical protein